MLARLAAGVTLAIAAVVAGNTQGADEFLDLVFRESGSAPIWRVNFDSAEVAAPDVEETESLVDISGGGCQECGSCGSGCCDRCCSGLCCGDRFLGLFAPSDGFTDFISPITNPVYFESPRTLTEARFIYLRHKVPLPAGGGTLNLFAVQLRAALTERLSVIATKDGYITSTNPLIDDGWANVNLGLKYNLFADYARRALLSAGLTYQLPVGSSRTLQANGDGIFNLFLAGGLGYGKYHWLSTSGFVLPSDTAANSQLWYWSNHFDRRLGDTPLFALFEFNWYHWMRSGKGGIPGVEGVDLFNFGSTGVAGNDIVTGAFGLKYKRTDHLEAGIAWELPLTQRRDVFDNRLTADLILRY